MSGELLELATRVRAAYGQDGLRLIGRDLVMRAGLDPIDAEFLSVVGVPREEMLQISFNLAEELPSLREVANRKAQRLPEWTRDVVCLNEIYSIVIGIDRSSGGKVVCIDLKGKLPERFVNSRVGYLVGFMAESVLHLRRWSEQGVAEEQSLQMAREWMKEMDSRAFEEEAWWTLVFEQIDAGLL